MKCELCSSDEPEPMRRLCLPCMEAVARLWNIVKNATVSSSHQDEEVQAAARTNRAPVIVSTPVAEFL
jgi:hypothetical protein